MGRALGGGCRAGAFSCLVTRIVLDNSEITALICYIDVVLIDSCSIASHGRQRRHRRVSKKRGNGEGSKRAILYARVSTEEQAKKGYSLAQQLEALREYAFREGYEVLEEVTDPGQSGASLERPGLDLIRDMVAAGGVTVVLAQDRDRFVREPAYHYLLKREFEEHGTKLAALNDRGDESPEGELTDGILDQLAKYERAKIAERTRRGMLRRVREGNPNVTGQPKYGFRYNEARDALVVHE